MHWLPNFFGRSRDEGSVRDCRGVHRNLVGACPEKFAHIVQRAHAAADGERHEVRASAGRVMSSIPVPRSLWLAVMSRKQSSLRFRPRRRPPAASTGSPASRRSTKFTPFTTRPSFTSRQGMMRIFNIRASLDCCRFVEGSLATPASRPRQWGNARAVVIAKRECFRKPRSPPSKRKGATASPAMFQTRAASCHSYRAENDVAGSEAWRNGRSQPPPDGSANGQENKPP